MQWRNHSKGRFYDPDESTVVYFDPHSGDTHLLSGFAATIVQQLEDQSLTTEELVDKVSPSVDTPDISELRDAVLAVLDELTSLDILKRD